MPVRAAVLCAAAAFAAVLSPAPARASAALDCSIDDRALALDVSGAVGHGMGGAIADLGGALTLKANGLAALGRLELSGEHLVHSWLNGRELRLHFYRDADTDGGVVEVELVVETTRRGGPDDPDHRGRYSLTVTPAATGTAQTFRGTATCSLG